MSMPGDLKRGGRVALHKIMLNEVQYTWVTKQLARREQLGHATGVAKTNPKLFKILIESSEYAHGAELTDGRFIISSPRAHLRLIGDIVSTQVDTLTKHVLPAYNAKSNQGEGYVARKREAEELTKELKSLSALIERVYEAGSKRRNSQYGKR